ncbi:MAG TPA: VWA domain-containing protein [Blastocatellia bacterium]|nr:VWA domain-containing protein [Blastocatellia bacterium]
MTNRRTMLSASTLILFVVSQAVAIASARSAFLGVQDEPLKLNATLVQVPAVVTDRSGRFVPDLSRNDFTLLEDGKRREISVFGVVKQPFTAALVLDTSNSAEDRLKAIQNAAMDFTSQLRPDDRMMVIAFDNEVKPLTEFTHEREELISAIRGTESGFGKLLYEAITRSLDLLKDVDGRRAVILFSDGVDMRSIEATAASTARLAEEVGAVIYVVRFDTRWWMEAAARKQEAEHPKSKTPFDVDGRIPLPPDFGGPDPTPTGIPKPNSPRIEIGQRPSPPVVYDRGIPGSQPERLPTIESTDPITSTLNKLYGEADAYLQMITTQTGGRLYLADNYQGTRAAFTAIADELRNQYLIGFYTAAGKDDGKYHKLKLESVRKDVVVRARPGYRVRLEPSK